MASPLVTLLFVITMFTWFGGAVFLWPQLRGQDGFLNLLGGCAIAFVGFYIGDSVLKAT